MIIDTSSTAKHLEGKSGNTPVLNTIFLTGRLSDVKDAPVMEEPKYVEELLVSIKVLGTELPLAEFVTKLESKVAESRKAIEQHDAVSKEIVALNVQEDIAKRRLREQYRLNYLHAQERL